MEKNLFTISVTIINFVCLIAIIFIIVKLIMAFINKSKGNSDINKKLDRIIELLEKEKDSNKLDT
jgi:large-conductance mechanosensitive channel